MIGKTLDWIEGRYGRAARADRVSNIVLDIVLVLVFIGWLSGFFQ